MSNETQLAYCDEYAAKQGWEVADRFSDPEISGDEYDRPGLWAAIDGLKPGMVLLVYRHDRLVRGVYLSEAIHRQVTKAKARVWAVHGGEYADDPDSVMVRQILSAVDEREKKIIASRTKYAMLRAQANGVRVSRRDRPPFGYTNDPDDGAKIIEHPGEQETIRVIMDFHRRKFGLRKIGRQLEAEGRYCRGSGWHHTTIKRIIERSKVAQTC